MQKIVTFLWFNDQAKEAVDLYTSLFENAKITNTSYLTESVAKAAGKKPGDVSPIDFELNGQNFTALNGGPGIRFVERELHNRTIDEASILSIRELLLDE